MTEYKGSARRGVSSLRDAAMTETPKSASKPLDLAFPMQVEDSYEAALRAADALFAPQRAAPQPAERAAPDPPLSTLEPLPASAPQIPAISTPERPAGRILRVLDEPPSAEAAALAALEVERAPKRRGRKPGSKNKPKPVDAGGTMLATAAARQAPGEPTTALLAESLTSASHRPADDFAPPAATRATPAVRRVPALPVDAAPAAVRSVKRYSWVKDRLRPGEDWKRRRLPKVCW